MSTTADIGRRRGARAAWAGLLILLAGAAPREPAIDPVLRVKLWMALFGIVILGIGLIFAVILGAGAVRRRARERYSPPSAADQHRHTPPAGKR